jgi:hypothetical protein
MLADPPLITTSFGALVSQRSARQESYNASAAAEETRMKSLGIALAAGGLLLTTTPAMAADDTGGFPDMRGQWKTSIDHVVVGSAPHYRTEPSSGEARQEKADATLSVTRQEGRKFWGEFSANGEATPYIGVIAGDKQTIYRVDKTGGHAIDKLTGPDTLDGCYFRAGQDFLVAGCRTFTRQH